MDNSLFEDLLKNYLSGTASEVEIQQLMDWYNSFDDETVIVKTHSIDEELMVYERLHSRMDALFKEGNDNKVKVVSIKSNFRYWKVAAALVILFSGYWAWKNYESHENKNQLQLTINNIQPGHEGAILTLADGKQIFLDSVQNGNISTQGSNKIIKKGSQVIYGTEAINADAPITYNTLETPKGREFEIVLPDSTKVWLNAASSIKFPSVFSRKPRIVEVTGEAYFEVSHRTDEKGDRIPFIVNTNKMTIQVLGTHFDVNSYADEPDTKTTLLEGSVAANEKGNNKVVKITPGQQAFVSNTGSNDIKIRNADVDKVIAWKNGLFQFNDDQLQAILRQVSRWYNVDIECAENKKNLRFNGVISKRSNVKALMDLLSSTGVVNFKIENGKLIAY